MNQHLFGMMIRKNAKVYVLKDNIILLIKRNVLIVKFRIVILVMESENNAFNARQIMKRVQLNNKSNVTKKKTQ